MHERDLARFVKTAQTIQPDATADDVADALWLWLQIHLASDQPILHPEPQEQLQEMIADEQLYEDTEKSSLNEQFPEGTDLSPSSSQSEEQPALPQETLPFLTDSPAEPSTPVLPQTDPSTSVIPTKTTGGGLPFSAPGVPALPGELALGRALRPLKRRVSSHTHVVFDEQTTVQLIAEQGIWTAVECPAPERWFAIDLVVDESASMVVWQQTIAEFRGLLERHGAFRDVRVWGIKSDASDGVLLLHSETGPQARNDQCNNSTQETQNKKEPQALHDQTHSQQNLFDATRKTLILVISDCVSRGWQQGMMTERLNQWGKHHPIAIVQVLPQRLWLGSALGWHSEARFSAPAAGVPNSLLKAACLDDLDDDDSATSPHLNMPVLTLEPESLAAWAKVITGSGGAWVPGFLIPAPSDGTDIVGAQHNAPPRAAKPHGETLHATSPSDGESPQQHFAEQRIERFHIIASPTAQELAAYLAAAPLTLPVMRLVQRTMLPHSRQVHLAEVFLGGLLKQVTPPDEQNPDLVQYDFVEDTVRELLLNRILVPDAIEVLRCVSKDVEARIGNVLDFEAILEDPDTMGEIEIGEEAKPFAHVAARVLRRLGGRYARVAERLLSDDDDKPKQPEPEPQSKQAQEPEPQVETEFSPEPVSSRLFPTTIDEWKEEIALRNEDFGNPTGYWCYVRPGTYRIGGWKYKSITSDSFYTKGDKRVLYEPADILLPIFWIAKHPITVAQYNVFIQAGEYYNENNWTPNGRVWKNLNKRRKPSWWDHERFKADDQPIIGLTWYEATAFAMWLSRQMLEVLPENYEIRLPTEAEWETAAAYDAPGIHRHIYPWGNEPEPTIEHAVYTDEEQGIKPLHPAPVGERPKGAAACGAHDMVGNVWERMTNRYDNYPSKSDLIEMDFSSTQGDTPIRGYAYYGNKATIRCVAQSRSDPFDDGGYYTGLRLVLSCSITTHSNLFPASIDEWKKESFVRNTIFGKPSGYWCYVSPGSYRIGGWEENEEDVNIELSEFWIAKFPITVAQYREFIIEGGYYNEYYWTPNGWKWKMSTNRDQPWDWDIEKYKKDDLPVTGVTWYECNAFAKWLNLQIAKTLPVGYIVRLPTEAEWEIAAAYDVNMHCRTYPWGDEPYPTPDHAVYTDKDQDIKPKCPAPVGKRPGGAAACGAHDIVGNVWERTTSSYNEYPSKSSIIIKDFEEDKRDTNLRGGGWYTSKTNILCMIRSGFSPIHDFGNDVGMRLVLSVDFTN